MSFWFEERRAAEEFGKVSAGNRQQKRQFVVFGSVAPRTMLSTEAGISPDLPLAHLHGQLLRQMRQRLRVQRLHIVPEISMMGRRRVAISESVANARIVALVTAAEDTRP